MKPLETQMSHFWKSDKFFNKSENKMNATYIFTNEDHTLGNSLRSLLVLDKDVELAGYSIVHPSEKLMTIRVQSTSWLKSKKYE